MLKIGTLRRPFALYLFAVLSVFRASATLTLTSDVSTACPGEAIVLTSKNSTAANVGHWLVYSYSYDQVNWNLCGSQTTKNLVATNMPDDGDISVVYYKVVDSENNESSKVISVTKNTSSDCAITCHQTSTGDYFNGTDFDVQNPVAGQSSYTPAIPDEIVSYFDQGQATVGFESRNSTSDYTVTTDIASYFNGQQPSMTDYTTNYYYTYNNFSGQNQPFVYTFPYWQWHDKYYRFVMRFYLYYTCSDLSQAQVKLETPQGNFGSQQVNIKVYDDKSDTLISNTTTTVQSFGSAMLNVGNHAYQLLRVEAIFYGKFPHNGQNDDGTTWNNYADFKMSPLFQQMGNTGCVKLAIDYISAEIESVCLDKGTYCLGTSATINAAGFPMDSYYNWQVQDQTTGKWSDLVVGGIPQKGTEFSRVTVPVESVGKTYYRVYSLEKRNNSSTLDTVMVTTHVTGKDCDPVPLDSILGDTILCAPSSAAGDTMTVVPIDVNPDIAYHWSLTDPNGNEIADKSVVYQETSDQRGTHIILHLPSTSIEGDYKLEVYMTKTEGGYTSIIGESISKTIHVYQTPKAHFTVDGFINDGKDEICPSDTHQEITATDNTQINSAHTYIYSWFNANSSTADGKTALIDFTSKRDSLCSGTLTKYRVGESVEIAGVGCKATWDTLLSVTKPADPVIDCDAFGSSPFTIKLGVGQSYAEFNLPYPKVTGTCDRYPTVKITGVGTDINGNNLGFTISANLNDMQNNKVAEMKRKFTATAGKTGNNGVTVTYEVIDGCGKSSNLCTIKYIVRDTIGPDIPCSNIPTYATRLSYYNVNESDGIDTCEAYPGKGTRPNLLPVITAPKLTDQNGVDGTITGEFMGRLDNQSATPAASEAAFAKGTSALNDPFPAGVSYILWKFADAAGNASYCIQSVVVTDDKKPEINCPDDDQAQFSVQGGTTECGLSLDSLLAKLSPAQTPTAYEICPTRSQITTARYFWRQVSPSTTSWTEITDKAALTFKLGNKYELAWRFYKQGTGTTVDKSVYAECIREFSVVDSVAPVIDCSVLSDTAVTVNINSQGDDLEYASASDKRTYSYITYTLKNFFNSIPKATDACYGEISPVVTVIDPSGKRTVVGKATDSEATILKALKLVHFSVGLSTIEYVYTDDEGNSSKCEQNVIVYERINMDCEPKMTVYADEDCVGHLGITAANVKKATVSYVRDYRIKPYYSVAGWGGTTTPAYEAVTQDDNDYISSPWGSYVSKYGFNGLSSLKDSMSGSLPNKMVEVYPYQVKKVTDVDEDGNATATSVTTIIKNTSKKQDFDWKVVDHEWFNSYWDATYSKHQKQVYKSISLQTSSFSKEFTEDFNAVSKGTHKLVWYYENGQGDYDSCVVIVSVVDSTAPSVKCGKWGSDITKASDPTTCQAVVNLTKPTAEQLSASDNCTSASDLVISFQRSFNGTVSTDMSAPFEQGTTLVTWTITDADGNHAYCKQNITVRDSSGPYVDCDKILVNPIRVTADENCQVEKEVMVEAGLSIPVLSPDAELCSPTKDPIKGVGVRQDVNGKPDGMDIMNDPYQLGQTVIVWTFTDSLGNFTECRQNIFVEDNTGPRVNCEEFENNPINYYLAPTECNAPKDSILARLGTHKVKDNCDADSIVGKPYLLANGSVRVAIPAAFIKDTTYTIEWVFTDKAGNESVCHQKFSVIDTTPPNNTDICPDPEKSIDAKVSCTLSFSDLELSELTINDPCDGKLVGVLTGEVQQPGGTTVYPETKAEFEALQYYAGTVNYFTWTFTDHAGLTSECHMTLKINDSIPPAINNCETGNDATYEMSEGVCYAKWSDLQKLVVIPVAYDECEELIDGNGSTPLDPTEIRRYFNDTLVSVSTGSDTAWRADPWERGVHRLVWVFADRSGNVDSCAKTIRIIMRTDPSFICDSVQPNPIRPIAEEGTCSVFFKDIDFGKYYGFNACTGDSIEAKLLLGPVPSALPVPTDLEFKVGDTIQVFWVVTDPDGNYKDCPQTIIPSHDNPINFDCNTLKPITAMALEGECYIPASNLGIEVPFSIDSCSLANGATPDTIFGVPTRSDGMKLMDNYPTGVTNISWMFLSPFNLNDTLVCNQPVTVNGNKHFDLNCEEILPTINDTVSDCGPDPNIVLKVPQVDDPCVADTLITGVAIARNDGASITDPFNLGTTIVTWTFTDATGYITDTCHQKVVVLTERDLEKPCDTAAMKMIEVPAPEDACTVPSTDVPIVTPYALHPCSKDTVWGVLSRPGVSDVNAPYNIGLNRLIWTFSDTTGTLVTPVDTCQQYVKVGNVETEPVDCKNMPDTLIILAAGNCTIDFSEMNFNVPPVIDRCPNGNPNGDPVEILPTITRSSKSGWSTHSISEIGSFGVGKDTVYWAYTISGVDYLCEQHISVKDSVEPQFDCGSLKPITAIADEGKCEVDSSAILELMRPFPEATETCTNEKIVGVPTLEDGSSLPATFKVGDTVIVKWTFIDTLVNTKAKECTQSVTVMSQAEPIFDCDKLDTLKFIAHQSCSVVLTADSIQVPVAIDSCTGTEVPGVASRTDGQAVYGTYNTGFSTITWTFTSPYSTKSKVCTQTIWVVTDLEIDAQCGQDNYPTIKVAVQDGVCSVPGSMITPSLRNHSAVNPCHNTWTITGVPSRSDGLAIDDDYPVGKTIITWTFTDTTHTLLNPTTYCEQDVEVGDSNEPPVDCETSFPAATIYLDPDNCSADFSMVPVHLNQLPVNSCNGDTAVLDTTRQSGLKITDPFAVGSDVIIWTFTYPSNHQKVVCRQNINVVDTVAPDFDCNTLAPVITVAFSQADVNYVTYEEVVAKGFYIPTVTDKCCEVTTTTSRSDGKALEDNYPYGETTVTFTFSDDHGNDKVCSQIIKVTDMIPPTPICPHFGGSYSCLSDIPAELNYDEWIAAGGTIDFPERVDFTTWKVVDQVIGDSCDAMVLRNYTFKSIREDDIVCSNGPDTFLVKDQVAPEYVGINPLGEAVNTACDNVSYNVPTVTAVDNCDPNPTVVMYTASTQGDDPSQCSYYTYDIFYSFTAIDRCGNTAEPAIFTVHVKDTMAPIIHTPADWDAVVHPTYLKHCLFGVPPITDLVPLDSIELACGEKEYLRIWQEPEAGTVIDTTTIISLHFTDVCGNDTVLYKECFVQLRKDIVNINKINPLVCGDDNAWKNPSSASNDLGNRKGLINASGEVWNIDFDGSYFPMTPTFLWDYYRDSVSESSLIYSDNPYTYASKFPFEGNSIARYNLTLLTRRSQSGTYFFVVTDTVTGCSDTASMDIDVRERPRLRLASSNWNLCDGDSLTIRGEFGYANPVCIDNMGSAISAQGWIVDDSVYVPQTPIYYADGEERKAVYYATNDCGTTTSLNTLYTDCGEGTPVNHADSLYVFGSEANVALAAVDSLYTSDSVNITVYTHYDPAQVLLSTDPQDKPRVWLGDEAELDVTLPYEEPEVLRWMKVVNTFDAEKNAVYDKYGNVISGGSNEDDDIELSSTIAPTDTIQGVWDNSFVFLPTDSASYYVVVGNGVCPTVPSNLVNIDLLTKLPTAITPYTKDGMNDDFVRGHHVIIFNRYGQQVFEGNDGWDGTYRGMLADPGVYFYSVDMAGGVVLKGSVEVVKIE